MRFQKLTQLSVAVVLSVLSFSAGHAATGGEPAAVAQVDVAPCLAATAADDMDKAGSACSAVIDNEKTVKGDLVKALVARGALYARHDQIDRAIADDSRALQLDPTQADLFNARGELWLKKGDKPKAVQDFGAALKIDPNHEKAKANHKAMARELERIGRRWRLPASPASIAGVPRARWKGRSAAIASSPISTARFMARTYARSGRRAIPPKPGRCSASRTSFIARRNAGYGRPGYDLKKAMQERLQKINGVDGY